MINNVELLENSIDAVIPLNFSFVEISISIKQITQLMKSLDQQKVLLTLSQQIDTLLVRCDHHISENPEALPFAFDLEVLNVFNIKAALLCLFLSQSLSLNADLEIKLPASFKGFVCVISIAFNVFK